MDCNLIKNKLLDYIDGILEQDEEVLVKEHLEQCEECNREYSELKSTIDYLENNKNRIDTTREINFNHNKTKSKKIRKFTRTGLIAVVLTLFLVVTSYGTEIFDFMKFWKRSSEITETAWEKLIENGVGDRLDVSVINNDVKITAEGVIADELNTVILLRIEDLKGNIRYTPFYGNGEDEINPITIDGDIGIHPIAKEHIVNSIRLYTEDENTLRLMLVAEPMTKDIGNIKISITRLIDMLNKDKESVVIKEGNWDIEISARKIKSKQFEIGEVIDLDGNELRIKKITLAPTETNVEYEFETYNSEKKYFLNLVSFVIEYKGKTYRMSTIGIPYNSYHNGYGTAKGSISLETLYLEDPSEIELIVEEYRYANKILTSKGDKRYNIDFNNLPQTIEYNDSQITIEDIIYNEDSVEIIIKEDDSKDRKYTETDMHITYDNGEVITSIYAHTIESELRDDKGNVVDLDAILNNEKTYKYIIRKRIRINTSKDEEFYIPKEMIEKGVFYIQGQRYIEFPNKKITIKLK